MSDLTEHSCYIVKSGNMYAHGDTLKEAMTALQTKLLDNMSVSDRIEAFIKAFPNLNKLYPAKDFFSWHHTLTGSCKAGRLAFATEHNIDLDKDELTVAEFIKLTENAYGGKVIKALKERLDDGGKKDNGSLLLW